MSVGYMEGAQLYAFWTAGIGFIVSTGLFVFLLVIRIGAPWVERAPR